MLKCNVQQKTRNDNHNDNDDNNDDYANVYDDEQEEEAKYDNANDSHGCCSEEDANDVDDSMTLHKSVHL